MAVPASIRFMEAQLLAYKRVWKGSLFTSFISPTLYLLAMGVGLGSLVDGGGNSPAFGELSYLQWLAPGLVAATAMQTSAGEASFPVMAGIKWRKTYHLALNSPLSPVNLVSGLLAWVVIRLLTVTVVFAGIASLFGAFTLSAAFMTILAALLTGIAFAALILAFTSRLEDDTGLSMLFRFGIVPLFLFSGTFFPISQLPAAVRPIAYGTPLWHGVELARSWAIGVPTTFPIWVHITVLAGFTALGLLLARWGFHKRLIT
jgi:lipooligosaccharide transport system permease protein